MAIGELARSQHGVVTLGQLKSAGLGKAAVAKRVKAGRLHRIHRGVYAVGHDRLTGYGRTTAAVLAYGPRAVASHRTAGGLQGLREDNSARTDVSLPLQSVRSRPGINAHAAATLRAEDVTKRHGIPCTTVARTLLDLADVVPRRQVERALEQAEIMRVFDLDELHDVLAHANGRRGAGVVRALLAELDDEPGLTANDLEDRFLSLCRAAGLPPPAVNRWIAIDDGPPIKADFVWTTQRLIVETDGWGSHGTRRGFERDRRRDQRARLAGWETVRFTRRQVLRDPDWVIATTAALLAR
jgi:very-short-patch-repair endonuclease